MTLCHNLQNLEIGRFSHEMLWFLEAVHPHLPISLSTVSLCFTENRDLVFHPASHRFWKALDNALTVSRFPKLVSVEITWARYRPTKGGMEIDLTKLHERGIFEKVLPTLYHRGILVCGYEKRHLVYPVTEHAQALLARGDWKSWRQLPCHRRVFSELEEE